MKRLSALLAVTLLLGTFFWSGMASGYTLTPVADATVALMFPPMNYYGETDNFITNINARSFLKFDLSPIPDAEYVISASLHAYQYAGARILPLNSGTKLNFVANDSWHDSTINWGNQPAPSVLLGSNPNGGRYRGWSTWGVTLDAGLLSDDLWSMVLVEQYPVRLNEHIFYSREYGSELGQDSSLRPYLEVVTASAQPLLAAAFTFQTVLAPAIVDTTPVPEPSTLLLVVFGLAGLAGAKKTFPRMFRVNAMKFA